MKKTMTYSFDLQAFNQAQKLLGLSAQDVANAMGVTSRTVYNINRGVRSPKVENLLRFCNQYGLDIRQFWQEEIPV